MAQKQTHIDQWKQAREPINKSTLNGQFMIKEARIQNEKKSMKQK